MRWKPFDMPAKGDPCVDFVQGLHTHCGAGHPSTRHGMAVHVYACNTSMDNKCMQNADGDFLIGKLLLLLLLLLLMDVAMAADE